MGNLWNSHGLIPPILPNVRPVSPQRSPYIMPIDIFVQCFSFTPTRCNLLIGLLNYRELLYNAGISNGFQWINGSFVERTEERQKRDPNDIDCVTFFYPPDTKSQKEFVDSNQLLFDHDIIKDTYFIDSYYVALPTCTDKQLIEETCYWYSLWSHNKDYVWKGFIEIPLNESADHSAKEIVDSLNSEAPNE